MKRAPGRSRLEHGRVKRPYCVSDDEMNRESAASPDVFTVRGSWRRQAWVVGASSGFVVVGALMLLLPPPAKSVLPWSEAGQGLVGLLAILFGIVGLAVMVYVASRPILHVGPDGLTDYRRRIDIPFVDIMSVSIHSQQYRVVWLSWLIVVGSLLAGCGSSSDLGQQEPTYVRQLSITETTVRGLDDGWSVGVQWVSNERYVDAEGKERRGLVARISVWNDALGQSDTLHVYEGMVFPIGEQRFQVIKLKTNRSLSVAPGSSNGYVVIGQLDRGPTGAPASGDRMSAQPKLSDSPQQNRTLAITVNTSRDDPVLYLTLIFEVRDKATQAVLHRQQTHASSRLAWSMRWLDNSVVQLQSSDVGTYCWQEQKNLRLLKSK